MIPDPSLMYRELRESPEAVARLLAQGGEAIARAAKATRDLDPRFFLSVARGSSDHAATYLKYATELLLRRPMASVGPSVQSIYGVDLVARGAVALAVSQSGQSPDIVGLTRSLALGGALTVALTNDADSPLAQAADQTLAIHAGPERSVAATKSVVTTLVAGLWYLAEIKQDRALIAALHALPEALEAATRCDWSDLVGAIDGGSLFTIGRGPSWAIANEAALKFKETCLIHAESYSSAEVQHGPMSIVGDGFVVIGFAAGDAAEPSLAQTADALADKGARVFAQSDLVRRAAPLAHVRVGHGLCDPILGLVSFYAMVEAVARARGINPDTPRHLQKVTQTV